MPGTTVVPDASTISTVCRSPRSPSSSDGLIHVMRSFSTRMLTPTRSSGDRASVRAASRKRVRGRSGPLPGRAVRGVNRDAACGRLLVEPPGDPFALAGQLEEVRVVRLEASLLLLDLLQLGRVLGDVLRGRAKVFLRSCHPASPLRVGRRNGSLSCPQNRARAGSPTRRGSVSTARHDTRTRP